MSPTLTIRVPAHRAGLRADLFFALTFPFLSRTRIRQKIQQGEALLNGRRFATSARLHDGDEIAVAWRGQVPYQPDVDAPDADAPDAALDAAPAPVILFEDAWYVAVDKPAGQASHPSGAIQSGTVIQQVRAYLRCDTAAKLARGIAEAWPVLANRLDRYTSGIVLVAKTVPALVAIQNLRDAHLVRRSYRAAVAGRMSDDAGSIDAPIGPARGVVGIRMAVSPEGLPSRTSWRVLERGADHAVLEAAPETGRQHQVRVHLASIGHPVIGDLLYPDEAPFLRYWANGCRLDDTLPARHLLHARQLSFTHPESGDEVAIESPIPADFTALLAARSSGTY